MGESYNFWICYCNCTFRCKILPKVMYNLNLWYEHIFFDAIIRRLAFQREVFCTGFCCCTLHKEGDQPPCSYHVNSVIVSTHPLCVERSNNWYLVHWVGELRLHLQLKPRHPFGDLLYNVVVVIRDLYAEQNLCKFMTFWINHELDETICLPYDSLTLLTCGTPTRSILSWLPWALHRLIPLFVSISLIPMSATFGKRAGIAKWLFCLAFSVVTNSASSIFFLVLTTRYQPIWWSTNVRLEYGRYWSQAARGDLSHPSFPELIF